MTVTTTDPSTLPQWNGHPVPWIARWTGEVIPEASKVVITRREDGGLSLHYEESKHENRDRFGVLWQREGINRGGEPLYGQVNTYRQRRCMLKSRCQVCGGPVNDHAEGDPYTTWLMPLGFLEWVDDEVHAEPTPVTATAPTCEACIPLALDVCPNLRTEGYELYHVLDWGVWGVRGRHHWIGEGRMQRRHALIPYNLAGYEHTPAYEGATLAQQQVVVWNKFVKREEHKP